MDYQLSFRVILISTDIPRLPVQSSSLSFHHDDKCNMILGGFLVLTIPPANSLLYKREMIYDHERGTEGGTTGACRLFESAGTLEVSTSGVKASK